MGKIDFVPNDYVQQRESSRANLMYLVLFGVLMGAIGVTFSILKMRQKAVARELASVNARMTKAGDQITQLEDLRSKSMAMMKTMVMTAELLEPVPRSVVLACLTNNLPGGVSLLDVKLEEKELKEPAAKPGTTSQYQKAAANAKPQPASAKAATAAKPASPTASAGADKRPPTETTVEIEGIAPSDIEVAGYIARLGSAILMDNVALVQSKERVINDARFREFKLKARLKKNVTLSKEDIERIRRGSDQQT